jgi:acyl-CoA thioesterase FadM
MYFKDLGQLDYFAKNGLFFAVTEMNIRYIREAKVFDELIIETTTVMEAPYLVFSHTIRKQNTGEKISEAVVKLILLSHERIPHDVPDIFCLNKFQDNQ